MAHGYSPMLCFELEQGQPTDTTSQVVIFNIIVDLSVMQIFFEHMYIFSNILYTLQLNNTR